MEWLLVKSLLLTFMSPQAVNEFRKKMIIIGMPIIIIILTCGMYQIITEDVTVNNKVNETLQINP